MPSLNFQKQFVPAILNGLGSSEIFQPSIFSEEEFLADKPKRQTIRELRKDGRDPKAGQTLYLYNGLRTKHCKKLGEVVCKAVYGIGISDCGLILEGVSASFISDTMQKHNTDCLNDAIAHADGFKDWEEMLAWFKKTHSLPFKGKLITW